MRPPGISSATNSGVARDRCRGGIHPVSEKLRDPRASRMTGLNAVVHSVPLQAVSALVEGALGVRVANGYLRAWRLPTDDLPFHHPGLVWMASLPAGVRLRFATDSRRIRLRCEHVVLEGAAAPQARYDLVVDSEVVATRPAGEPSVEVVFDDLPDSGKAAEVWLPQEVGVRIRSVEVDDGTDLHRVPDARPHWVTYGSSITHCLDAPGPTDTWPARAARQLGWKLTCLGYAGMCHLDPLVARAMAKLPADRFTLKLGINIHNLASLRQRTFAPLVHGFLATLRDAHATTPITVISPIISPSREHDATTALQLAEGEVVATGDLTLEAMRRILEEVVSPWQQNGDANIDYLDGRHLLGEADTDCLPDGLHPDDEGNRRIADRFVGHFSAVGRFPASPPGVARRAPL